MQPMNQYELQAKVDGRLKVIRIMWLGLFISVGLYYLLTVLTGKPKDVTPNATLSIALTAAAMMLVAISIPIKWKYLTQSVDQQRTDLVNTGYIVALALCEAAALFALLDHFLTGDRYYFVLFIIAGCGYSFHFPRRQHLLDACFKGPMF